jgi:hypothetical protein
VNRVIQNLIAVALAGNVSANPYAARLASVNRVVGDRDVVGSPSNDAMRCRVHDIKTFECHVVAVDADHVGLGRKPRAVEDDGFSGIRGDGDIGGCRAAIRNLHRVRVCPSPNKDLRAWRRPPCGCGDRLEGTIDRPCVRIAAARSNVENLGWCSRRGLRTE